MTALSAAAVRKRRGAPYAIKKYKMANSSQVYKGGLVMINSAGLALAAAASASNKGCVGVATESKLSGTGGNDWIEVEEGEFLFAGDTLAQTAINALLFADDDNTVDETQAADCPVAGMCSEFVSASAAWVRVGQGFLT